MYRKILIFCLLVIFLVGCSSVVRQGSGGGAEILTERELWQMHRDVRFTSFMYDNSSIREGFLLRWEQDSILIQPRGAGQPAKIPSSGIIGIRVEIGNRILESLLLGTAAAGAYIGLAKSYSLGEASTTEALAKLLGPPLIIFGAMAIGSTVEKSKLYRVPEEFEFDYDEANSLYKLLE